MEYKIVPRATFAKHGFVVEGKDAEDAMANFAANMDSDMNCYFEAIPVKPAPAWTIKNRAFAPKGDATVALGSIKFEKGHVCITDPCYNYDVWCRINNIGIVPGEYNCYVEFQDEGDWGVRVARLGVYLQSADRRHESIHCDLGWKCLGYIGVDAGLAGIFERKDDFSDDAWHDFCDDIHDGDAWLAEGYSLHGLFSSSGYGDGSYDVYGHVANGHPELFDAIEIVFLGEDEDEEEEEDE